MEERPTIRRVGRDEVAAFAPLYDAVWPEGAPHDEDVRWAFATPPGEPAIVVGAFTGEGKAVAARGSMWWPLAFEGRRMHACQLHGTCVSPDLRRQGLFSATNKVFLDLLEKAGGDAIFNVSVHASREGYQKLGWTYLPGLRRLLFVRRPLRVGLVLAATRGESFRGGARPTAPAGSASQPGWSAISPLFERREEAMGPLAHTRYDADFYGWRFSGAHARYGWAGDERVGYAVYRTQVRGGLPEVLIGDLWPARYTRLGVARLVARVAKQERPALMTAVLSPGHPLRRILASLLWFPDPKGDLNMGVRPVSEAGKALLDGEKWALSMGDIDTF